MFTFKLEILVCNFLDIMATVYMRNPQNLQCQPNNIPVFKIRCKSYTFCKRVVFKQKVLGLVLQRNHALLQEAIKGSIYLPYLALESTLSRVDLLIECLPQFGEPIKTELRQSLFYTHAHLSKRENSQWTGSWVFVFIRLVFHCLRFTQKKYDTFRRKKPFLK